MLSVFKTLYNWKPPLTYDQVQHKNDCTTAGNDEQSSHKKKRKIQ